LFEVNIVAEFHVLCMNPKNFKMYCWVWNTDVNFSIGVTETPQSGIDGVGSVSCRHDYNIWTSFETIHKRKQLRNNTTFDFSVGLEIHVSVSTNMEKKEPFSER